MALHRIVAISQLLAKGHIKTFASKGGAGDVRNKHRRASTTLQALQVHPELKGTHIGSTRSRSRSHVIRSYFVCPLDVNHPLGYLLGTSSP